MCYIYMLLMLGNVYMRSMSGLCQPIGSENVALTCIIVKMTLLHVTLTCYLGWVMFT